MRERPTESPTTDRPDAGRRRLDGAVPGGLTRRSAARALWSVPVLAAAAVAAPGAAAAGTREAPGPAAGGPTLHTRLGEGPFVGLVLSSDSGVPGRFDLYLRLSQQSTVTTLGWLVVPVDCRIDIETDQDVASWADGMIVDGPRAAHVLIPAGTQYATSYSERSQVDEKGYQYLDVVAARPKLVSRFAAGPAGTFAVRAAVTSGRVYTGSNPSVQAKAGRASAFALVQN